MSKTKLVLASIALVLVVAAVSTVLPAQMHPQTVIAQQPNNECPADTAKGAYHIRGYDKQTGAAICGFTYFNECPYFAGAEAGTPECEKGKPTKEQLEPWKPNTAQPQAAQTGGK
jgi:hypothetical protein